MCFPLVFFIYSGYWPFERVHGPTRNGEDGICSTIVMQNKVNESTITKLWEIGLETFTNYDTNPIFFHTKKKKKPATHKNKQQKTTNASINLQIALFGSNEIDQYIRMNMRIQAI